MAAARLLNLDAHADISRSTSRSIVEVGKRIHTRTISFVSKESQNFEKILQKDVTCDKSDDLLKKCKQFVRERNCTHYVKAIMLGATEYEVLDWKECRSTFGVSEELKIDGTVHQVGAGASAGFNKKVEERQVRVEYTKIGSVRCDDNKTEVEDEQVIDIEIAPIHELIAEKGLRDVLQKAVKEYTEGRCSLRCFTIFTCIEYNVTTVY